MATPRKPIGRKQRETRTYSDVERANALAVLASCNGNLREAHAATGVPIRTLASWREKPMAGSVRAAVPVREQLLAQTLERWLWRLLHTAKGKLEDAKLSSVITAFGTLFDRWRLLKSQPTIPTGDAAAGLDLSRLSADELRVWLELVEKAGGEVTDARIIGVTADAPPALATARGALTDSPEPGASLGAESVPLTADEAESIPPSA